MAGSFLLALAAASQPQPCVPPARDRPATSPGDADHRALRLALNEAMPDAPVMVMLHGEGGHLATDEYSIVLVRSADGSWRGTAVGRSRIWVEGAPYTPMKRVAWTLERDKGRLLDAALSRTCTPRPAATDTTPPPPPPRGYIAERVDVVRRGRAPITFHPDESFAALVRPR